MTTDWPSEKPTTPGLPSNAIEVGNIKGTACHFIAVPPEKSELCREPLSGKKVMSICIDRADIPWLIEALQNELHLTDCCEHAIVHGDWCEECNAAYKQAQIDNGIAE